MINLKRIEAIKILEDLQADSEDYLEGCIEDYKSMTNDELESEFCLSGLFAHHYPHDMENDFQVID